MGMTARRKGTEGITTGGRTQLEAKSLKVLEIRNLLYWTRNICFRNPIPWPGSGSG